MKHPLTIAAISMFIPSMGQSETTLSDVSASPPTAPTLDLLQKSEPLYVFEWGVNGYDWSASKRTLPELPGFIYTPQRPGTQLGELAQGAKVRDHALPLSQVQPWNVIPHNGGIIFKPLLYVKTKSKQKSIPLGVELKFEGGDAVAWWPQAHIWRTPELKPASKPVSKPVSKTETNHSTALAGRFRPLTSPLPQDPSMELEWQWLDLTKQKPEKLTFKGLDLENDHWIQQARKVDSLWISNKKEAEKYIFYEGTTTDLPDIAVVHTGKNLADCQLLNTSCHALHDVFIIYNKDGKRSVHYLPQLLPFYAQDATGAHPDAVRNVSLTKIIGSAKELSNKEHTTLTKEKLAKVLSPEKKVAEIFSRFANPPLKSKVKNNSDLTQYSWMLSAPQYVTTATDSALTPDLANSLAEIWDKEFFHSEGLTIIYRESSQQLDQRIPMRLCTDARHGIIFSRCGLVLNSNIDLTEIKKAQAIIDTILSGDTKTTTEKWQTCLSQSQALQAYLTYKSATHPHMEAEIKKIQKRLIGR